MLSSEYRHRQEPKLFVVVSRAKEPGQRLGHVQVIATAVFNIP